MALHRIIVPVLDRTHRLPFEDAVGVVDRELELAQPRAAGLAEQIAPRAQKRWAPADCTGTGMPRQPRA